MHKGKFGTAISCMDGRVQLPTHKWLMKKYGLDYIDTITEPGPDKLLSLGTEAQVESIKARVLISVNAHGSETILISGHHDCAGNPVSREEHIKMVRKCVYILKGWNLPVKNVIGAWIDDNWTITVID